MTTNRFQFGIARLLILTLASAVVLAVAIRIEAPQLVQWVVAIYLGLLAGWGVLRVPAIYAGFQYRRHQLEQYRRAMAGEAEQLRQSRRENESQLL